MFDSTEWLDEYELPALPALVFGTYNLAVQMGLVLVVVTAVCYMIIMLLDMARVSPYWERDVVFAQLALSALGLLFDIIGVIVLSVYSDLPTHLLIVSSCTLATQISLGMMFVALKYRQFVRTFSHLDGGVIPQQPRARHNNTPEMPEMPGEHAPRSGLADTLRRNAGRLLRTKPVEDLPSAEGSLLTSIRPVTRTHSDRVPIVTSLVDDVCGAMGPPNVTVRDLPESGPSGLGRKPSAGKTTDRAASSFVSYKTGDEYATTVVTV